VSIALIRRQFPDRDASVSRVDGGHRDDHRGGHHDDHRGGHHDDRRGGRGGQRDDGAGLGRSVLPPRIAETGTGCEGRCSGATGVEWLP